MEVLTIFLLVIIPLCFTAWQFWRARRAILAAAREQADIMDEMSVPDAFSYAFLGSKPR
jgi:hypothetical protein